MAIAENLILIILGVNLMLFVFGNAENNSPILSVVKGVALGGSVDWSYLLYSIGMNSWVYITLMSVIILASYKSGSNPLTGGGGYASILTPQMIAIGMVSSLLLMPNFSVFGFPDMVEYIVDIVFGGLIAVAVISLLRGQ